MGEQMADLQIEAMDGKAEFGRGFRRDEDFMEPQLCVQ